ncbi:MAG: hypothetical protein ABI717_07010, partial [Actinomycetota bacterium]
MSFTQSAAPGITNLISAFNGSGSSDLLGMLGQVADLFASIAQSSALQSTHIPFTSITIGQAIDYATVFKHEVLDPLFKSGDILHPDSNNDGKIDLNDLNFDGIQSMLSRIAVSVGLPANALTATYDPVGGTLKFNFTLDPWYGLGTSVAAITGPKASVTTVVTGGGSTHEVQELVVNATGGVFKLNYAGKSTSFILLDSDATTTASHIASALNDAGVGANVTVSASNGIYRIAFNSTVDEPELSVDLGVPGIDITLGLLDSGKKIQTIVVPQSAGTFWIAYPNSDHVMQLTDKLHPDTTAADLQGFLRTMTGDSGLIVTRHDSEASSSGPVTFTVKFAISAAQPLVAAGGFDLDFGTSLGSLGGVSTAGSVIPLAGIFAHATFGIDLGNPSDASQVSPTVFQAGPRVEIQTTQEGGKAISVTTVRGGNVSRAEIQVLTVRGTGTFDLSQGSHHATGTATSTDGAGLAVILNGAGIFVDSVTSIIRPEGTIYRILFTGNGDQDELSVDGTNLTARNEVQTIGVYNANGGTFTLQFGAVGPQTVTFDSSTTTLRANMGTALDTAIGAGKYDSALATVTPPYSVTGAQIFKVEFQGTQGGKDVTPIVADAALLAGALQNGKLLGNVNFTGSLYNGPSIVIVTTRDGVTDVTTSTILSGTATTNEVQVITVSNAASGSFVIKWDGDRSGTFDTTAGNNEVSDPIAAGATAIVVLTALTKIDGLAGRIAVADTLNATSTTYIVVFTGFPTSPDVPPLTVDVATKNLTPQDEQQTFLILNASSGTFTLTLTTAGGSATTSSLPFNAAFDDVKNALGALTIGATFTPADFGVARTGNAYTVTFHGSLAGKDVALLGADASKLRNTVPLGSIAVALAAAATSSAHTPDDLVAALQDQINAALVFADLTPGFITTGMVDPAVASGNFVATVAPFGAPQFQPLGPHIHYGQTEGTTIGQSPVAGALTVIALLPGSNDVAWVGSANGGIWRTDDLNLAQTGLGEVEWTPLLDLGPSMSITALELDTTALNTTIANTTLVAGIGIASNYRSKASPLTGLIRTTNGGGSWQQLGISDLSGLSITGLAPRGLVIVVAANDPDGTGRGGVWRSVDGTSFYHESGVLGLPIGDAYDLQADPMDPLRLFVSVGGATGGVFVSTNNGESWTQVGDGVFGAPANSNQGAAGSPLGGTTDNIRVAVHHSGGGNAVYAAVDNGGNLAVLARFDFNTAVWARLDLPGSCETTVAPVVGGLTCTAAGTGFFGFGPQGSVNLALVASPTLPTVVYISGTAQPLGRAASPFWPNSIGATDYTGQIYRCNSS